MKIENIKPEGYVMKGVYTPAKKIDIGDSYLIFVSGVQAPAGEVNEVTEDSVFDMEGAIICEWALKKIPPSSVAFIKAVSDDGTTRPSAADVTQLIRQHLAGIKQVAESLAEVRDAHAVTAVPEDLADELRLSQYMRNEFASLRHYAEVSGRKAELEQMLDNMRGEGRIPVKDKRAGKEILDEIFARLR